MKPTPMHERHWDVDSETGEIIDVTAGEPVDFTEGNTAEYVAALPDVCRELRELLEVTEDTITKTQRRNVEAVLKKAGC